MKLKLFIIEPDPSDSVSTMQDCTRYHMECSETGYQHRMLVPNANIKHGLVEYEEYLVQSMANAIAREITRDAIDVMETHKLTFSEYYSKVRGDV